MELELLKRKFLQLSFSGKVTSQSQNEDSIIILYEQIKIEKADLVKKLNTKNDSEYTVPSLDEIPFSIPDSWKWVRIGELGVFKKGPFGSSLTKDMFIPKSNDAIKVYEQQNAINKDVDLGEYYIKREYYEEKMKGFEVFSGDIIVSCAGTIGECYIMPENMDKGIINQALMKMTLVKSININYFLRYFDYMLKDLSNKEGKGTGMKNIPPFDIFKKMLVPLPPYDEQIKIVTKINEVFDLLDKISVQKEKLIESKKILYKKIINLAVSGNMSENTNNWDTDELGKILIYEQPSKYIVDSTKYSDEYQTPVLTPGKTFILGYTNETNNIYDANSKNPVLIFDDFTTATKFVNFPFKVKSSAMKILHCEKDNNIKFYYYLLQSLDYDVSTHKRYWISEFSHMIVPVPPKNEQDRIVEKVEKLLNIIEQI